MIDYTRLANTIELCAKYYQPETFEHCLRVAKMCTHNACMSLESNKEVIFQVGLCHDLLEDTNCTMEEIAEATGSCISFIENVIGALTRQKDETYMDYIQRIKNNNNSYSYIVKLTDIKDHLMHDETLTDSLKERYYKALPILL